MTGEKRCGQKVSLAFLLKRETELCREAEAERWNTLVWKTEERAGFPADPGCAGEQGETWESPSSENLGLPSEHEPQGATRGCVARARSSSNIQRVQPSDKQSSPLPTLT